MSLIHSLLRDTHILAGGLGLLAGAGAMSFRKGSVLHRRVGTAFVVAMLTVAVTGALMATVFDFNRLNISGASLTLYLVLSAWVTVLRAPGRLGRGEMAVAALGALVAVLIGSFALRAIVVPAARPALPFYLVFGSIVALATAADVRLIRRGGIAGSARTVRHLWRMCTAMLIATMSFFIGQARLFPSEVRESNLLPVPVAIVAIALIVWLIRYRPRPLVPTTSHR